MVILIVKQLYITLIFLLSSFTCFGRLYHEDFIYEIAFLKSQIQIKISDTQEILEKYEEESPTSYFKDNFYWFNLGKKFAYLDVDNHIMENYFPTKTSLESKSSYPQKESPLDEHLLENKKDSDH